MQCLIIEDDFQTLEKVTGYINNCPELTLAGGCSSLTEALKILNDTSIDLLFLDIELGGNSNGLDFYRSLEAKPYVIVMTSHSQYAVDSYAEHLAGFLYKPFGFELFRKTVNYVLDLYRMKKIDQHVKLFETETGDFIPIPGKRQSISKVYLHDICFLEQTGNDMNIYTTFNKHIELKRTSLIGVEKILPPQLFSRINRSVIVNITCIQYIMLNTLAIGNRSFPISPKYKKNLKNKERFSKKKE